MNNKLLSVIVIILFIGLFTAFITLANTAHANLLCSNKQKMIVTLKNEANIETAKNIISEIPHIKIIKIQNRDKEWSKMVNRMDLPNMENPFKHEFTLKIKRNANINDIYNKIKEMNFVENVKLVSSQECAKK